MSEDLRRGLLTKKGGFDKLNQQCTIRIQRVRQKNDVIQRQLGTDIEDTIRTEIKNQKKFIEQEITELKDLLNQIEKKFRDPESKTKIKQLKADAQKQIERNKIILKELINRSFAQMSIGRPEHAENADHFMEGGKVDYESLDVNRIPEEEDENKASMLTDQAIEVDYDFERRMLLEKNEMINEVEQSALRINDIMNDMAVVVDESGEHLDIITDELANTHQNMVQTNENLEEAADLQKKSKKKYSLLVMLVVLVIVVVAGVIFFLLQSSS